MKTQDNSPSSIASPRERNKVFDRYSDNYETHVDVLSMRAFGGGGSRAFVEVKCRELLALLKANGIDPLKWIMRALEEIPNRTVNNLHDLLPKNNLDT